MKGALATMMEKVMSDGKSTSYRIRIGMVGLGSIAQKAYLPVLSQETGWQLVGLFSPNQEKTHAVCRQYRLSAFPSLDALAAQCDAVFVHSSTASHYDVVSTLLRRGVHVYVDKPLAETLPQAESLLALAERQGKTLMVGFNRRFAPCYRTLKSQLRQPASIRVEKHRVDNIGPHSARFTLLDDYLHVVDTALWLAGESASLQGGVVRTNEAGHLCFTEHVFTTPTSQIVTSMHRRAGSQRESVQVIDDGIIHHVDNLHDGWQEHAGCMTRAPVPSWQSVLEQRGFVGAIQHFVTALEQDVAPETAGEQAVMAQRMIESMIG